MEICVEPILYEQKSVFIQMLELYNYDFSEFSNDDINEYGYFGYEHIDVYSREQRAKWLLADIWRLTRGL